jgi:hypothetical protein
MRTQRMGRAAGPENSKSVWLLVVLTLGTCWQVNALAQAGAARSGWRVLGRMAEAIGAGLVLDGIKSEASAHSTPQQYMLELQWSGPDGMYAANLQMNGLEGQVIVQSPGGPVAQDIHAMKSGSDISLQGSNPMRSGVPLPPTVYAPDVFRLVRRANGEWTIADMCDTQRQCAPVTVVAGSIN